MSTRLAILGLSIASMLVCIELVVFQLINEKFSGYSRDIRDPRPDCTLLILGRILTIAKTSEIELVAVDPDIIKSIWSNEGNNNDGSETESLLEFSESMEHRLQRAKNIIHLALIHEASGGQKNIEMFIQRLHHNNYDVMRFDHEDETAPEIRPISANEMSHNPESWDFPHLQKLYTKFTKHLFILNNTKVPISVSLRPRDLTHNHFRVVRHLTEIRPKFDWSVVHIMVLSRLKQDENYWLQSHLELNEIDQQRLQRHNVRRAHFKIPFDHNYIHLVQPTKQMKLANTDVPIYVFKNHRSLLDFTKNKYVSCKPISRYDLDGERKLGIILPDIKDEYIFQSEGSCGQAFDFIRVTEKAYNIDMWLTGWTLFNYLQHCDVNLLCHQFNTSNSDFPFKARVQFGVHESMEFASARRDFVRSAQAGIHVVSRDKTHTIEFYLATQPWLLISIHSHYFHEQSNSISAKGLSSEPILMAQKSSLPNNANDAINFNSELLELCQSALVPIGVFKIPCHSHSYLYEIFPPPDYI